MSPRQLRGSRIVAGLLLALAAGRAGAEAPGGDVVGVWVTDSRNARIEIYRDGDTYAGRIVAVMPANGPDGRPMRDLRNADPALRARPLEGLVILTGLRPEGPARWGGGRIYRPEDGKTYSASLSLTDRDHVVVTGSIGIFRGSRTWTRAAAP